MNNPKNAAPAPAPEQEEAKITLDELSEDELDNVAGGVKAIPAGYESTAGYEKPVTAAK